jgi:signal transduction histidine kinase
MNAKKTTSDPTPGRSPEEILTFLEGLKRQWMETVDAIVDPLMVVSSDYDVLKANRAMAKLAGKDVKAIVNRKCYTIFANRTEPCVGCRMQQAGSDTSDGTSHQSFNLDGIRGERFYEATSQPMYDASGKREGTLQVYSDRTEAKRLQGQLIQAEKLASIGLLAGGIAHEINNPLSGILIFSQMVLREMDQASPHFPDVVEIEAAAKRCKGIVENLLAFARQQPLDSLEKKEPVNLKQAIRSALRFSQVGGLHNNVDVEEDFGTDEFVIPGNFNQAVQLFLNLIQNAFQAMPDGGTLALRSYTRTLKTGATFAVFEVEDTGIGIPDEHQKHIFDPFFTSKGPGEGTGLGLSISYGIAQDLGGTIEVRSEINQGSCFRLVVPCGVTATQPIAIGT